MNYVISLMKTATPVGILWGLIVSWKRSRYVLAAPLNHGITGERVKRGQEEISARVVLVLMLSVLTSTA